MKRKISVTIIFLQCFLLTAAAQSNTGYYGTWAGKLPVGAGLRLVFHIKDNGTGGLVSTADSPDQSAFGLKCDTTWLGDGAVNIEMHSQKASYKAKLVNDSTLEGIFHQGMDFPLTLTKTLVAPTKPNHPQEPKAPFPYKSEDIIYNDAKTGLNYGATITIPEGKGPFPAALLITGSGQQNRDEEILGHKPFAVLADALTRNGIAVLRVDDRGVGKTTGQFKGATTADFADDARAGLNYLRSRSEVDKKKTGLIGHSEGGMIAPMVAAGNKDVSFIVLLAGPGVKISQLMAEQNAAISHLAGVSDTAIRAYIKMYTAAYAEILQQTDTAAALAKTQVVVKNWLSETDPALLQELHLDEPKAQGQLAAAMVNEMQDKWYRYFMTFDPAPYLEKLSCKVLALNGSRDVQVISSSNLAGIEAALKKSRSKVYTVKELPGLNHLFQTCKTCTPVEYSQLEETFSPAALGEINNWLNTNVK